MKTLKFLVFALLAVFVFIACDNKEPGSGQPENPSGPEMHKGAIVLNWGKSADVAGKTFEIGMDNWVEDAGELQVHLELTNESSESKAFKLLEVRKYDPAKAWSSVCASGSGCMGGDNQAEQEWDLQTIAAGEMLDVQLHILPYEAGVFSADFTVTDGTDEVKFTINYNYTPAE